MGSKLKVQALQPEVKVAVQMPFSFTYRSRRAQLGPGAHTLRAGSQGEAFGVAHRALALHSPLPGGGELRQQKRVGPSCAQPGARKDC